MVAVDMVVIDAKIDGRLLKGQRMCYRSEILLAKA